MNWILFFFNICQAFILFMSLSHRVLSLKNNGSVWNFFLRYLFSFRKCQQNENQLIFAEHSRSFCAANQITGQICKSMRTDGYWPIRSEIVLLWPIGSREILYQPIGAAMASDYPPWRNWVNYSSSCCDVNFRLLAEISGTNS